MREDEFIRELTEILPPPHPRVIKGVGDDCCVIKQNPSKNLVISVDTSVENVHFSFDLLTPQEVGYRGLAAALSDIAAMGGEPLAFMVNLQTPRDYLERLKDIYRGYIPLVKEYCLSLAGGNISRGKELAITYIVLGEVSRKGAWLRSGARPGDVLFLSGDLGRVKAFFASQKLNPRGDEGWYMACREKFAHPTPRIKEVQRLRSEGVEVTSAIDVSDGLSTDAFRLATSSGVNLRVDLSRLPIHDCVKRVSEMLGKDPVDIALSSGEEYELLFTVPQRYASRVEGLGFRRIGRVVEGPEAVWDEEGREIRPAGWQHF